MLDFSLKGVPPKMAPQHDMSCKVTTFRLLFWQCGMRPMCTVFCSKQVQDMLDNITKIQRCYIFCFGNILNGNRHTAHNRQ